MRESVHYTATCHSQGSNCCSTPSAAAKHVGNSDFIPSMASESKHGKADSELRSLLVGLSSDTLDGEKYLAVLNSSTVLRRSLSNFSLK